MAQLYKYTDPQEYFRSGEIKPNRSKALRKIKIFDYQLLKPLNKSEIKGIHYDIIATWSK